MTKPSYKRQCDVIEKCDKLKGNRNGVKWVIGLLIMALALATITTVGLTIYISKQKSDGCHSPSSSRGRGRGGDEPPQSLHQQSKSKINGNNADAGTNTEWFYGFYETKEIFDIPDYFQRTPFSRNHPKPILNIRKKIKNADIGDEKSSETPRVKTTDVRLPRHLIPTVYDLNLQPNIYSGDPATFTFDGYVKINLDTREVGSNVTLHTNKITIHEDTIRFGKEDGSPGGPNYSGERSHDDERQFEIFSLDGELVVGERYYIEMNFTGPLTGDLAGLYLSQYQRGADTVYIATTHMEPTEARKAFPCFDEPQMKAVFNVKLVRKNHLKSLSNMNIIGTETMTDEFEVDIYNTSEKMSTYLIAFVVCDFEYTETVTRKGVQYRAWSRPEYINQTSVSLRTGSEVIDYFADYFGIGYPLPKEDMIAVPDFGAGAMENWGLITYRETAMLFEEGVSSESDLQRVNTVIAHELAHMWFGDLVTMEWWDDLWLNEGFASFVEYMGVDFLHPDWKMFEQFITDLYEVFEIDALVTSHPIYVPVENPDEISEIFDGISYSKGASIIRMMRFFLGEKVFQEGVQIYLKNREFQNANHNDLWAGLEEAARKQGLSIDVPAIMDTWILQMNYPVVKVTKSSSGKIQLEQNRFLTDPDAVDPGKYPSPYNYTWKIPFTFTTKTDSKFNQTANDVIWLEGKEIEIPKEYPAVEEWVIGNTQQYGVYRVHYDDSNWLELIDQLKIDHKAIHAINRAQVMNDAFALAKAELLSMDIALQTVDYLQDEEEYIPWVAAGIELAYIDTMLSESSIYGLFEKFMRAKVEKQFERLGLNDTGSSHLTSYVRASIAGKACAYGNVQCVTEAKRLFEEYMTTQVNPISPGLKSTVYCTALRYGGEPEWEFAFDMYKTATVAAEKNRLLSALSCTTQPWLLYREIMQANSGDPDQMPHFVASDLGLHYLPMINKKNARMLDLTLQPDVIRKQDAYQVYIQVGGNKVGSLIAWNFFRGNWNQIFQTYGTGSFSLSNIIRGVTSTFNTDFLLQEMKAFQREHPNMGTGTRAFSQAIEAVETNIIWMSKNYESVKQWLERPVRV